jgi:hypothetical protein
MVVSLFIASDFIVSTLPKGVGRFDRFPGQWCEPPGKLFAKVRKREAGFAKIRQREARFAKDWQGMKHTTAPAQRVQALPFLGSYRERQRTQVEQKFAR